MPAPRIAGHAHAEAYHCLPDGLVLVDDPASPFYDKRIKRPVPEWLIQSVQELGVIEPIEVMRDGARLVVDNGRQRVRACREANKRLLKAGKEPHHVTYVIKKPRDGDAGILGLARAANLHVEDSPIERAEAAARLVEVAQNGGMSAGEARAFAASRCGVSGQCVANWLALLNCASTVQKAVDAGEIPETCARDLAKLPREKQTAALDAMRAKGVMRGNGATRAVAAIKRGKAVPGKTAAKRMQNRATIQQLADMLAERELKSEGNAALAVLQWVLRAPGESDQADDVAECLDEMTNPKTS